MNKTTIYLIMIIIFIILIEYPVMKENFLSGGTIQQLMGKDSQDLYLNTNEIKPLVDGDFVLQFNQPTLMQNRNVRNKVNPTNKKQCDDNYVNNYPFGTDFYDDGDTGSIFFNKDFNNMNMKNEENNITVIPNQYTGDFHEDPMVDIYKPLRQY